MLQNDLNNILDWTKIWGMSFNVDKCEQMTVTNKKNPISTQYYIGNNILTKKETIKYLGVLIDKKLTFKQHIQVKSQKATTVLNMLKRNLHFAPKSVKCKAYQACVQPILEYASNCWAPTSKTLSNKIEMVHHNAAKFVSNRYPKKGQYQNFSISKVLHDLGWISLEERRKQSRLVMAYNLLNGHLILEPTMIPKMKYKRPVRQCNEVKVGTANQLMEPESDLDVTKSTFFFATPKMWNDSISPSQANAPSVKAFKRHFKK